MKDIVLMRVCLDRIRVNLFEWQPAVYPSGKSMPFVRIMQYEFVCNVGAHPHPNDEVNRRENEGEAADKLPYFLLFIRSSVSYGNFVCSEYFSTFKYETRNVR